MYEDDTPLAERRAQALALDRDLLKELLGQEELRDLIDPAALEQVEDELRGSPKSPDQLHDLLLRRGDLRPGEYEAALAEPLEAERRAVQIRVGGEIRLIAAEDAGRYRDAVGAMPPSGLPDAFLESGDDPLGGLLVRYARGRGPFTTAEAAARFAIALERAEAELAASSATDAWSAASFGPVDRSASGASRTFCAAFAARASPRCARRSSRWTRRRSAGSCPLGTGSIGGQR